MTTQTVTPVFQFGTSRFDNPFLDHRLSDIATGHPTKVEKRIGDFLSWAGEDRRHRSPRLQGIVVDVSRGQLA